MNHYGRSTMDLSVDMTFYIERYTGPAAAGLDPGSLPLRDKYRQSAGKPLWSAAVCRHLTSLTVPVTPTNMPSRPSRNEIQTPQPNFPAGLPSRGGKRAGP